MRANELGTEKRGVRVAAIANRWFMPGSSGAGVYLSELLDFLEKSGSTVTLLATSFPYRQGIGPATFGKNSAIRFEVKGALRVGQWLIGPKQLLKFVAKTLLMRRGKRGGLAGGRSVTVAVSKSEQAWLSLKLSRLSPDVVIANYCWMVESAGAGRRRHAIGVITHDVWHEKCSKLRDGDSVGLDMPMISYEEEVGWLNKADFLIAINERDAHRFAIMSPRPVIVAPKSTQILTRASKPTAGRCLFVGSSYSANVQGIRWFLDSIWPLIVVECPTATLDIVGAVCAELSGEWNGVTKHGTVEDLDSYYTRCEVVVVPLLIGSGLKIKLIEAMGAGAAIVSTSIGLQGVEFLKDSAVLCADSPEEFAKLVVCLLSDKERRERVRLKAKVAATSHFSPEQCYGPLRDHIASRVLRY